MKIMDQYFIRTFGFLQTFDVLNFGMFRIYFRIMRINNFQFNIKLKLIGLCAFSTAFNGQVVF